jgi:hypothetical protein
MAEKKLRARLESVWNGLSRAEPDLATSIQTHAGECVRIRARQKILAAHLSGAIHADPAALSGAEVITDADLLDAACDKSEGTARPADLYLPPRLLVLQVGCVAGRPNALPKVILGAILRRLQASRPTWIVDFLGRHVAAGHPVWSDELATVVGEWPVVDLEPVGEHTVPTQQSAPTAPPALAAPRDLGPDEVDGLDPKVAEQVRRGGWRHRPQGNGGTRIHCQDPKHPDAEYELSIYEYRKVALYKCQTCGAKGVAAKLSQARRPS